MNKLVTTHSLHLDVGMRVPHFPGIGERLTSKGTEASPGGGFIGASAARAQGVAVCCASPLGTGPNSHAIRRACDEAGIHVLPGAVVGDVGVGVSMIQKDGRTASVVAPGVEADTSVELLESVVLDPGDVVLVHGTDLATEPSASVLGRWVPTIPDDVTVVVAASPAVEHVPADIWFPILERADVVSMNIRETAMLRQTLERHTPGTDLRDIVRPTAAVVRRLGSLGCDLQMSRDTEPIELPSFPSESVDTTGVGDTHVAVMCAALLEGFDMVEACSRANAAGALAIEHEGAAPAPTRDQVDEVLKTGRVPGHRPEAVTVALT